MGHLVDKDEEDYFAIWSSLIGIDFSFQVKYKLKYAAVPILFDTLCEALKMSVSLFKNVGKINLNRICTTYST